METREEHYASMMQAVQRYAPSADLEEIQKAYEYADRKHKNQLRKSGEPYIIHPLAVAEIVAEIGLDTDAIVAALLHDCLEDTDASFDEISHMFGQTVAELVEGVTKLTRVQYSTTEEQQMENLRKMFMAMSKDIRVILIKIADRLHNTRTLQYQTPAKQISKSMETMEIYAPLAHRLGMQKIKWELEDVSLQYLDPEGYQQIIDYLHEFHERHPVENHRPACLRRHPRVDLRQGQAHVFHLPQDARAEQDNRRAVRFVCFPRDCRQHCRLLQCPRSHSRSV